MPESKYIKLKIDGEQIDMYETEVSSISIDYQFESGEDFQKKRSSESFDINVPATLKNDKVFNTFHNSSVADMTEGEIFKSSRNIAIEANGYELLVGKAFLTESTKQYGKPLGYQFSAYGNNADWIIPLKETTLYDCVKHINFIFSKQVIEHSWQFNGKVESEPFVFAPVKYGDYLDKKENNDNNYSVETMRPSLSLFWLLYWGFKLAGYQMSSAFFDTDYFRRITLPWTWGAFLSSEGTKLDIHKFLAKSQPTPENKGYYFSWPAQDHSVYRYVDLKVTNDNQYGAFDNDDSYEYVNNDQMQWTYNGPNNGVLEATLACSVFYNYATSGDASFVRETITWYVDGVEQQFEELFNESAGSFDTKRGTGVYQSYFTATVNYGQKISAKIAVQIYLAGGLNNVSYIYTAIDEFKLDYFRIPQGGEITFDNYLGFQKYKFLDLVAGVLDCFDISPQTDSINKIILLEPSHDYSISSIPGNKLQGYFVNDFLDWTQKQDLSKLSKQLLFNDYDREVTFKFKEDSSDGAFKVVQDRNQNKLAASKYVFPDRFKAGKKNFENRFFSSTMHYDVDSFKNISPEGPPQMVCLVPENISNTSSSEAENTFLPKLAWYKGLVSGFGGWKWDGVDMKSYPFMFAVNYKDGGEIDPILSYSDEKIGKSNPVIGMGLLKRFFWQRLAIMRNGQWLTASFKLNNNDVSNWFHREFIVIDGQRWELLEIKSFKPLSETSTECTLRLWSPVSQKDDDSTYPSKLSLNKDTLINSFDLKYAPLKCLSTDIPQKDL